MNIFATFSCPVKSAEYLDDERLIKMTLESLQMLSTAAAFVGRWQHGMCRPTHVNHPCNVWVRQGRENFQWLYEHALALDLERWRRWGRCAHKFHQHATLIKCDSARLCLVDKYLPYGRTPFANSARHRGYGLDFTHLPVHRAYRKYLEARWILQRRRKPAICKWTPQAMPPETFRR